MVFHNGYADWLDEINAVLPKVTQAVNVIRPLVTSTVKPTVATAPVNAPPPAAQQASMFGGNTAILIGGGALVLLIGGLLLARRR